jgi:hypothetical protein
MAAALETGAVIIAGMALCWAAIGLVAVVRHFGDGDRA